MFSRCHVTHPYYIQLLEATCIVLLQWPLVQCWMCLAHLMINMKEEIAHIIMMILHIWVPLVWFILNSSAYISFSYACTMTSMISSLYAGIMKWSWKFVFCISFDENCLYNCCVMHYYISLLSWLSWCHVNSHLKTFYGCCWMRSWSRKLGLLLLQCGYSCMISSASHRAFV